MMALARLGATSLVSLCCGCAAFESSRLLDKYTVKGNDVLVTGAEFRTVSSTEVKPGDFRLGHIIPRNVRCAEPSPDVAKAIADAFAAAAKVSVSTPRVGVDVEGELQRQRSEALAQLGERLATIQLLRDGLFRACEAYANGAVGPVEYGAILSVYDDLTVTLLLGELAAGAFGRSLAAAAAGPGSGATAAQRMLVEARNIKADAQRRFQDADAKSKAKPDDAELKRLADEAKARDEDSGKALEAATAVANREAVSGTVFAPGGSINLAGSDRAQIAAVLKDIHATYLSADDRRNRNALVVGCMNAMSRVSGVGVTYSGNGRGERAVVDPGVRRDGLTMFTMFCAQRLMPIIAGQLAMKGAPADQQRTRALERRIQLLENALRRRTTTPPPK